MTQGLFIALEGLDGSGTTTQTDLLVKRLHANDYTALGTCEPSANVVGQIIRRALKKELTFGPEALAALFAADRLDHVAREIEPALANGKVVISDRYLLSSLAYQTIENPLEWVVALNQKARRPDLNLLLRVHPSIAAKRLAIRGGSSELFDETSYQARVADAYEKACALDHIGKTHTIQAEGNVDMVAKQIWEVVVPLLRKCKKGT